MSSANFAKAMPHIFGEEGGYVDHSQDPGGATNMGITIGTLTDWRNKAVSKADVKALMRAEATAIYKANYWHTIRGDELPPGVDYAVFDFAVNSGPGRAARYLQMVLGVPQDGIIGPVTLAAARNRKPQDLINAYCDARLKFLRGLGTWGTFGNGWESRVARVRNIAVQMANNSAASIPSSVHVPEPPPPPIGEPALEPEEWNRVNVAIGVILMTAAAAGAAWWLFG